MLDTPVSFWTRRLVAQKRFCQPPVFAVCHKVNPRFEIDYLLDLCGLVVRGLALSYERGDPVRICTLLTPLHGYLERQNPNPPVQGYLAHKKYAPLLSPRDSPTVGSQEGAVSYERGTPVGLHLVVDAFDCLPDEKGISNHTTSAHTPTGVPRS